MHFQHIQKSSPCIEEETTGVVYIVQKDGEKGKFCSQKETKMDILTV